MKAYDPAPPAKAKSSTPGDQLRVAVTFKRPGDRPGPTKFSAHLSTESVSSFRPEPADVDLALAELARHGFEVTTRGELTVSVRCTRAQYEKLFGTKLATTRLPTAAPAQFGAFFYPPPDAPWSPDPAVESLIDDAYIQWPHIYMAAKPKKRARTSKPRSSAHSGAAEAAISSTAPTLNRFHLDVPGDVARLLNATHVHHRGITGAGVRVAMIDSGFAHSHPFFGANGYSSSVVLAARANNRQTDLNGHGTGESANVFAVAPGVTFIGVKVDNDDDPTLGASVLEGFQEALRHNPDVISVSLGYDLRIVPNRPDPILPNGLIALEAEIQAAIANGIVVVFSAGNGHYAFPGQMPELISAGGVFVDEAGAMRASDYASAFPSAIYLGRSVPDFCGLVGLQPHADYIALPISPGCEIDRDTSAHDGTTASDGWGVFSGTSAAAPQIAGVCALLLQAEPGLSPAEVKAVLRRTSRDVLVGTASAASDPSRSGGIPAGTGEDGATGAGLVDALAAVEQVL